MKRVAVVGWNKFFSLVLVLKKRTDLYDCSMNRLITSVERRWRQSGWVGWFWSFQGSSWWWAVQVEEPPFPRFVFPAPLFDARWSYVGLPSLWTTLAPRSCRQLLGGSLQTFGVLQLSPADYQTMSSETILLRLTNLPGNLRVVGFSMFSMSEMMLKSSKASLCDFFPRGRSCGGSDDQQQRHNDISLLPMFSFFEEKMSPS